MSRDEKDDNKIYKELIRKNLATDQEGFCPFRRERQFDYLFPKLLEDFEGRTVNVLDACCGYGRLIHFMNELDGGQRYTGFDYVEELVAQGRERFRGFENISILQQDVYAIAEKYPKQYDLTINYKTLSWLPYYEELVRELIAVTREKIYITSLFHEGDIDIITRIYAGASSREQREFSYLNTYSLPRFVDYCMTQGAREVRHNDMHLDLDIEKPLDPNLVETYTERRQDGGRFEITAGVVLLNWKLVEIIL